MFKKKITGNDVMNGTFGSIWINGDKAASTILNYEQKALK